MSLVKVLMFGLDIQTRHRRTETWFCFFPGGRMSLLWSIPLFIYSLLLILSALETLYENFLPLAFLSFPSHLFLSLLSFYTDTSYIFIRWTVHLHTDAGNKCKHITSSVTHDTGLQEEMCVRDGSEQSQQTHKLIKSLTFSLNGRFMHSNLLL